MKTVLYIAPYYAQNDHGHASRYYLRELAKISNLVTRPVYLYTENKDVEEFHQYEIQAEKFDVIIQDVPPHKLDYEGGVKNIAITQFPTIFTYKSTAIQRLNMMDEVWCLNEHDEKNLLKSGLTVPLKVFEIKYELPPEREKITISNPLGHYVFGWIGEPQDIDDLDSLLTAFHTEFHTTEPVSLLLNVKNIQRASEKINEIKAKLRIHRDISNYKKEVVTTLDFENLPRLIPAIDAFISTDRGNRYNRFEQEFFLTGKNHIKTTMLPHQNVPCICLDSPMQDLFTAKENWKQVLVDDLRKWMRNYLNFKPKTFSPTRMNECITALNSMRKDIEI